MNADTDVKANGWTIDEDNLASNLDTKVPTQQSVKAYVDANSGSGHTIEEEGSSLTSRTKLNFVGASVTATDDAGDDASVITITGEANSTADQTGAEIKTAYEGESDTNAFTDSEKVIVGNTSNTNTGDEPDSSATVKGIVELATITEVNTGTDAGRAVTPDSLEGSALQIKVDAIEASADVTDTTNVNAAAATIVGTIATGTWEGTAITTNFIGADSIDGTKMADNAVNSEHYTDGSIDLAHISTGAKTEALVIAASDNTTALATGIVFTFYMPYAMTLTDIRASVLTAPTDATLIVDVHDAGTTIMTTDKLDIETTKFHTKDATTQPTLTDTALANNSKIEIIVDQIGSSVAGAGLVVYLIGYQT